MKIFDSIHCPVHGPPFSLLLLRNIVNNDLIHLYKKQKNPDFAPVFRETGATAQNREIVQCTIL